MDRNYFTILMLVLLGIGDAAAEQALESFDALKEGAELAAAVEDKAELIEPVSSDSGASLSEQEEIHNPLPAKGFVPGYDPNATRFHLTATVGRAVDQHYVDAMAVERDGRFEQALKAIRGVLVDEPTHKRARLAEGRLLVKTGQYDAGIAVLRDVTDERTDDWRPWYWLGTGYLLQGDLSSAEVALDEALNRGGDVVEIWIHRALVAQERDDWRTAMQLLRIAAELAPNHPMVMLNVGIVSDALGYGDSARAAYRKFLTRAHEGNVSNLVRFEVINHLSEGQVVEIAARKAPTGEQNTTVSDSLDDDT